jgi:ribosomal protein S18 acetylase RimI-like enzyme
MATISSQVQIRDAREDERAAIADLTWSAYKEYATVMTPTAWRGLEAALVNALAMDGPVDRIVAVQDGKLIGSVMLYPPAVDSYGNQAAQSGLPELRLLAVSSEARNQGIGRALVEACVERSRLQGAKELGLHTSISMQAAMRLYEQMGFVRFPEDDFQPEGAELVMAYRLNLVDTAHDT